MRLNLYFIRHGETEWSLSGQHTGRANIPLTTNGENEALIVGQRIREVPFAQIFCSPLIRAKQTCELAGLGNSMQIDADLAEWDNGDDTGKTRAEIIKLRPSWNLFRDGCPNGEMPAQVHSRVDRLVNRFIQLEGNIAVFSHSHLGRALAARWIGIGIEFGECFLLDTTSVSILTSDDLDTRGRAIKLWNSTLQNSLPIPIPIDSQSASAIKQKAIEGWENEGGDVLSHFSTVDTNQLQQAKSLARIDASA
ncbi:MAG: histidine phosphatase family protein [Pirellula sp.]|jgi:broad specificity phosphatase PhoE